MFGHGAALIPGPLQIHKQIFIPSESAGFYKTLVFFFKSWFLKFYDDQNSDSGDVERFVLCSPQWI